MVLSTSCWPIVTNSFPEKLESLFPGLMGEELLAILELQACQQMVDIAVVESKHASIRNHVS